MITKRTNKIDDGVSPVVGVMLMLVVTIVIAAVVAVFAAGIGVNVQQQPLVLFTVDMSDDGLKLTCTNSSENLTLGKDFYIYINHWNNTNKYTDKPFPIKNNDGTLVSGVEFNSGKSIVYTFKNMCKAYAELDPSKYGTSGSNSNCWTYGGSKGATIGKEIKVQLRTADGKVIAESSSPCHRST